MEEKIKLLISTLGENRVKTDIDLSEYLKTGLGGKAESFYIATTTRELIKAVELCRELKIDFLLIGSGSKIAISDTGFKGLAIKNRAGEIKVFGIKGKVTRSGIGVEEAFVEADSGASLVKLAEFTASQNLGGFEILKTSLGSVGGSLYILPVLREKTHQVKVLDKTGIIKTKQITEISREDIILSVVFRLKAKTI